MKKAELQIELVVSELVGSRDNCIARLNGLIESRKGVDKAHFRKSNGEGFGAICVHFDSSVISIGELRQYVVQAGAGMATRYGHMLLRTPTMNARQARKLNFQLTLVKGVLDAGVSAGGVIRIEYAKAMSTDRDIRARINGLGVVVNQSLYPPPELDILEAHIGHDSTEDIQIDASQDQNIAVDSYRHVGMFGGRSELIFTILCGVLLLAAWLSSFIPENTWIPGAFYASAYFFGGFYVVRETIEKILLKRFEIDFLIIVAAIGAAILGACAEGALLLFLFAMGHELENYAMGRTRKVIEALAELAPERAFVRRGRVTSEVPVEQLVVGDIVIIKINERIAADGFVVKGESSVNQCPITGESVPVDKLPVLDPHAAAKNPTILPSENRVFAGTFNESGSMEIQVTQLANESTLARVVTMAGEAETYRSTTQEFTDKFEHFFVPAVVVGVVLLLFAFLVIDEPFSASFYRAMAVMVGASPCALAIATPIAVLSGVARAARGGVLIKGGGPLENLGRLSAIAFDKSDTLTEGKPRITEVVRYGDVSESDFLRTTIAVEQLSDHPLAAAVVQDGKKRLAESSIPEAHDVQSITGRGIKATVDGRTVYIGKDDLFAEVAGTPIPDELRTTVEELEGQGRTTMIVRRDDQYLGVIGLMDTPRQAAKVVIAELRELGIEQMIMISEDNQHVDDAVAKEVGIDDAWGDLMPSDKVEAIKKLRSIRDIGMVGDGVNGAPAMANATVGIAMGAAGSDVALESADVAIMADELSHLPFAVGLSRQTSRIIRQNLWCSLGMVAILVPATILGLRIGFAVLLHEVSTLVIVFNALRLLVYKK